MTGKANANQHDPVTHEPLLHNLPLPI